MIKIGATDIKLTMDVQTSTDGRPFRISGVSKKGIEKWVDGVLKHHWVYSFKYLDDGTFFTIEIDYNNKFVEFIYVRDNTVMEWFNRTKLLPGEKIIDNSIPFIAEKTGLSGWVVGNIISKHTKNKKQ